jgi:hypothetical protein
MSEKRVQQQVGRGVLVGLVGMGVLAGGAGAAPVSFQKQIQPILQRRCQGCHQPASQGGKLVVTSYALLKAGGNSGPVFQPGAPDKSLLVQYVSGAEPKMPKGGPPLPTEQVGLLRRWV